MNEFIGHIISNRYRVEAFLGKGGMAEVYKIWDQKRSVYLAMKILHADLSEDKVFLRRFRREAQTLSKLQHPNIVRFYGLEQDGDLVYILMDYVEGTTLRKEIFQSQGSFSNERILEIMQPVCAALQYAHNSGFVHCDVKPANIMIHRNGTIYISDFGISRMTEAATMTMVGAGTPAYMAPEQVRGEEPAPQTDIYSLGVVLFEMLTGGERPFTGENAKTTGSTSEKVRWEQMRLAPPLPSKFNPSITSDIDGIVTKCLNKSPTSRHHSALDLLNDLARYLAESLPSIPPISNTQSLDSSISAQASKRLQVKKGEPEVLVQPIQRESSSKERVSVVVEKDQELPNKSTRKTPITYGKPVAIAVLGLILFAFVTIFSSMLLPKRTPSVEELSPVLTSTKTFPPSSTPKPTNTARPTRTPNFAATQHFDKLNDEAQKLYDLGYLKTLDGRFVEYDDFKEEWAQLGWYSRWTFDDKASDLFLSAHFKWSSAYQSADTSGCGFIFAEQDNGYHYSVFLDRSKILFAEAEYYFVPKSPARGTDRVNFGNPFDKPAEADFTLVVRDYSAFVLVDGDLVGEYNLSQNKNLYGKVGVALLSGTNKDFGTRCEITNMHLWIPK